MNGEENKSMHAHKLGKSGRLRHKTLVDGLFAGGRSFYDTPLRMVWKVLTREELEASFRNGVPSGIAPLQTMVTVPKKKRRHAVDRVLMRRRIREAYRLSRGPLAERLNSLPEPLYVQLAFVYLADYNAGYADVEKAMVRLLDKLAKKLCPEN